MDKYLITGFSGFVSKHFLDYLEIHSPNSVVLGVDVNEPTFSLTNYSKIQCSFKQINLLDTHQVKNVLETFKPNYILHLASYSSVAFSWQQPVEAFVNNLNIFLNLVDQIRLLNLPSKLLSIGSSEEYGKINTNLLPLTEETLVNPISPYAVARVSQEQLSKVYSNGYNLDIVITRSFNHIGPGQTDKFAIPSFVKKILQLKETNSKIIKVGNIDIIRDFIDVRDVVKAYFLLLKYGKKGEIYNICSGSGISLREVLSMLMNILEFDVTIEVDDNLVRPSDNEIIIGSNEKIMNQLSWKPTYTLENSLVDIINYWKQELQKIK